MKFGQGLPPADGWKRDMPEPKVEHTHGPFAGPYSSCPACSAAQGQEWICPKCGDTAWLDHCSVCGAPKPDTPSAAWTQTGVNVVNTSTADETSSVAPAPLRRPHKALSFFRNRWRLRRREEDTRPYFEASIIFQAADMAEADRLWDAMHDALGCTGEGDDHVCPHFRVSGLHQLAEEDV